MDTAAWLPAAEAAPDSLQRFREYPGCSSMTVLVATKSGIPISYDSFCGCRVMLGVQAGVEGDGEGEQGGL